LEARLMLPIAFANPMMLLALAALPALWILLRLIPPRPRRIDFPPLKLILDLTPTEETPARTPWWLTALRLAIAALVILMLAGPVWKPTGAVAPGSGPLLLVIDNGWAAARDWSLRARVMEDRVAAAQSAGRPVAILATAEPPGDVSLGTGAAARERLRALKPEPWTPDRAAHLASLGAFLTAEPSAHIVWYSDGLASGQPDPFVSGLAAKLDGRTIEIVEDGGRGAMALAAAENAPAAMTVKVLRALTGAPSTGRVRALDIKNLPLGEAPYAFEPGGRETVARLDLPVDLRNEVARLEIAGEASAGAVQLLDDRWRRRTVGIASGQTADVAQPLLSATYYVSRALEPFADLRSAEGAAPGEAIGRFIDDRLPVIILSDVGNLGEAQHRLTDWVEGGGVLVRFAGTRLAASTDPLVPVTLRRGGRTLGGALSWEKPQPLGAFAPTGPFAGLAVPADVTVTRQVLAEPDGDLPNKIWATLADGTPLVTAAKRGKGMIVLFHVTADTTWSNLTLSGGFVEMLRRIVALSGMAVEPQGAGGGRPQAAALLPPTRTLDGQGAFEAPPATAEPVQADQPGIGRAAHPPGFYGPPEGFVAVNTLARDARLTPLAYGSLAGSISPYAVAEPQALGTPLLAGALLLLMADALIVFLIAGGFARLRRLAAASAVILLALVIGQGEARAQTSAPSDAALKVHLAYVITGDRETDETSAAGLRGLSAFISDRTALEPGEPMGVDVGRDELAFHALLYWPIVPGLAPPPQATMAKVDAFMKSGGTIIFDTRDALQQGAGIGSTSAGETLQRLLASLDIPELEPVPRDHVLTKTFFLMDKFPGRYDMGDTWVEAMPAQSEDEAAAERPARAGDGVSPIIITGNDLAGAWAVGPDMSPLYPLTPGGPRQRELAYRAGVNLVMYALTGNYKADQVHVPALLERLGQ
jgi:hypothetical protein